MKIYLILSIIFLLFILLAACNENSVTIPITGNPSAQSLMNTLTEIAKTVEVIEGTATAYAFTPTPTFTPTKEPNPKEVSKTIGNAIKDQLISTFGASIALQDVKFGPIGAQEYTQLYIEINCTGDNSAACPTSNVIIALMEACKQKKKQVLANVPKSTQMVTITIFDPINSPRVLEINWSDVVAFINGDIPADVFSRLIRYIQ
jgi:hypothetical protein